MTFVNFCVSVAVTGEPGMWDELRLPWGLLLIPGRLWPLFLKFFYLFIHLRFDVKWPRPVLFLGGSLFYEKTEGKDGWASLVSDDTRISIRLFSFLAFFCWSLWETSQDVSEGWKVTNVGNLQNFHKLYNVFKATGPDLCFLRLYLKWHPVLDAIVSKKWSLWDGAGYISRVVQILIRALLGLLWPKSRWSVSLAWTIAVASLIVCFCSHLSALELVLLVAVTRDLWIPDFSLPLVKLSQGTLLQLE